MKLFSLYLELGFLKNDGSIPPLSGALVSCTNPLAIIGHPALSLDTLP